MANEDKFNVKKIIKNGAKVVICGTDTIQAEKWINVNQTAFRALQVPNKHKTWLASCLLQEEAYQGWKTTVKTKFRHQDLNFITWEEFVEVFNE